MILPSHNLPSHLPSSHHLSSSYRASEDSFFKPYYDILPPKLGEMMVDERWDDGKWDIICFFLSISSCTVSSAIICLTIYHLIIHDLSHDLPFSSHLILDNMPIFWTEEEMSLLGEIWDEMRWLIVNLIYHLTIYHHLPSTISFFLSFSYFFSEGSHLVSQIEERKQGDEMIVDGERWSDERWDCLIILIPIYHLFLNLPSSLSHSFFI